jgi:hypothetical protein
MAEKPIGVMPLSIIAIAFGVMGFFGGAMGLGAVIWNPKQNPPGGMDPKLAQVNAEFAQKMEAVTREARPVQLILLPAMILTSIVLLAGGISGIKMKARSFVQLAFGASLVVDSAGAVYGLIVQARTMDVTKWYLTELASSSKMPAGVEMGMKFGFYAGLFMGIGWLVAKTVFYILGVVYFGKKNVREAFDANA